MNDIIFSCLQLNLDLEIKCVTRCKKMFLYLKVDNLVSDVLILLLKEEEKFVSLNVIKYAL